MGYSLLVLRQFCGYGFQKLGEIAGYVVNIVGAANAVQDIGVAIVIGGDQNCGHAHVVGGLKVARDVLKHGGSFRLDIGLPDKFFVRPALGLWNVVGMHDVKNIVEMAGYA